MSDLKQIYRAVAAGQMTKAEAMAQLRVLKTGSEEGVLTARPRWVEVTPGGNPALAAAAYSERHLLLLGFDENPPANALAALLPDMVISQAPSTSGSIADAYTQAALYCFGYLQQLLHAKPRNTLVQVVVNVSAQPVLAGISGLLKTLSLENPQLITQCLLLDTAFDLDQWPQRLAQAMALPDSLLRLSAAGMQVLQWREVVDERMAYSGYRENGCYLITGGLGGIGRQVAADLLRHTGSARVILCGRRDPADVVGEPLIADSRVEYRGLDVSDAAACHAVFADLKRKGVRLNGVFHCAGALSDGFALQKTPEAFARGLAAKVQGAVNIDAGCAGSALDFIVYFSSLASSHGNAGQADYAAANGFLDQLAGLPSPTGVRLSINWPLWQEGGMQLDQDQLARAHAATGLRPLGSATGLQILRDNLTKAGGQLLVLAGDIPQLRKSLLSSRGQPRPVPQAEKALPAVAGDRRQQVQQVRDFLCGQFADVLKMPAAQLNPTTALEKYGIDSLLAMTLTSQLEKHVGPLPKTLFFEYQTIAEVGDYLLSQHASALGGLLQQVTASPASPAVASAPQRGALKQRPRRAKLQENVPSTRSPVAIVGVSGRYPESPDLTAFWQNLRDGVDCISEVPRQRWNWQDYYSDDKTLPDRHYSKWGGFIAGVDEFDPRFFNIAPREAAAMDPQERLFLQHAWLAIEDAGITRKALQACGSGLGAQVGVYAGVMYGEYQRSGSLASIANRVSYFLNLHGPSMVVDTMCSSSLTAIHLACQDLLLGRTQLAIAGGVNVSVHPGKYLMLSAGQFISTDGHCQSFGEGGDGYIPGEGVGVLVLKRLVDAERDGNPIYGIIRGSSLNHGGKTNGYTVPNPQAQAAVIADALAEAAINPRHVGYIEAHGTGTKLGDPIEIAALSRAFEAFTRDTGFCLLGSAKSNIGHCESAAGIAGVTKVLLQLKHRKVVPSLHSARLNPHIDFARTPFVVNQQLTDWPAIIGDDGVAIPRIAGVSSFGAGGANAHVLLQEYVPTAGHGIAVGSDSPELIVLSARTDQQLVQKMQMLLSYLQEKPCTEWAALAYTLQLGREPMAVRWACVCASPSDLARALSEQTEGVYSGVKLKVSELRDDDEMLPDPLRAQLQCAIQQRDLESLAALWLQGINIDWQPLSRAGRPGFIALPGYPFAREVYWQTPQTEAGTPSSSVLHPLLTANISDLYQQCFRARFTGQESFLVPLGAGRALPIGAYLEMARAAALLSSPAFQHASAVVLENCRWGEPFLADGETELALALLPGSDDEHLLFEFFTTQAGVERVHCQGHARVDKAPAPARHDLASLCASLPPKILPGYDSAWRGGSQLLARWAIAADGDSRLGLSPDDFSRVLHLAGDLLAVEIPPLAVVELGSVQIYHSTLAASQLLISVDDRDAPTGLTADFCDAQGNVLVRIARLTLLAAGSTAQAASDAAAIAEAETVSPVAEERVVEVANTLPTFRAWSEAAGKPSAIVLAELAPGLDRDRVAGLGRVRVSLSAIENLSALISGEHQSAHAGLTIGFPHSGVAEISIDQALLDHVLAESLVSSLAGLRAEPSLRAVVLRLAGDGFLSGERDAWLAAQDTGLPNALAEFPVPVIAAVAGDALDAGFLTAAVCDFMVLASDGRYGLTELIAEPVALALLAARFDRPVVAGIVEGSAIGALGACCPVVRREQVVDQATQLACELAAKSSKAIVALKQHMNRPVVAALMAAPGEPAAEVGRAVDAPAQPPAAGGFGRGLLRFIRDLTGKEDKTTLKVDGDVRHIQLLAESPEVLHIRLQATADSTSQLLTELALVIHALNADGNRLPLLLSSDYPEFLPTDGDTAAAQHWRSLGEHLAAVRYPMVAALDKSAQLDGLRLAALCDLAVVAIEGSYGGAYTPYIPGTAALLRARFGHRLAAEWLLAGTRLHGQALAQINPAVPVVAADQVLKHARQLAISVARLPVELADIEHPLLDVNGEEIAAVAEPLRLHSAVIRAERTADGVVVVEMADRQARNMFSDDFMAGMNEVFGLIGEDQCCKSVVLVGYDNYFASGGTRESLLAIQQGKGRFTDDRVYQLALTCPVPVVAAMQGHGIGAGWALGMFADFCLFSEESRYFSPYMNYGFTPGAGATLIVPYKMGMDLGRESLFTAREYSGAELAARGLCHPVLPRAQVRAHALGLATQIARAASREQLVAVKAELNRSIWLALEDNYTRELAMHELTFVGQAETLAQIENRFQATAGESMDTAQSMPADAPPAAPTQALAAPTEPVAVVAAGSGPVLAEVFHTLRDLLAQELHLSTEEIDGDSQFIDLGLDSITGVTWVRKINEHYGTALEATKVYSYPSLNLLSAFVIESLAGAAPASAAGRQVPEAVQPRVVDGTSALAIAGIRETLKVLLADELHMSGDDIEEDAQFVDLGLDSITGVTWVRKVNAAYDTELEATRVYSYPTIVEMANYLADILRQRQADAQPAPERQMAEPARPVSVAASIGDYPRLTRWRGKDRLRLGVADAAIPSAIAIIGMAGQFPKARNIDEYWQNIRDGKNCISEIPADRWDLSAYYRPGDIQPGKTNSKWLGALADYDKFDPLFFNLSPGEAELMDPQQRLFLETCWNTLEHAGYNPQALSGSRCGVFVGCATGDYFREMPGEQQHTAQAFTGGASSILAARISYFLNFRGPCIALETACSSSLVAIANACDSLVSGDSELAIAGGVNVMAGPSMHIMTSQSGMLSPDGRCYTFDNRANGFVPGEAVGAVLLKRLDHARRDGDTVHSVIRGWGVNQDGKTNGITAPSAESQAQLLKTVYRKFALDPAAVQLIEAHGTGTKLGDPIEIEGLLAAFPKAAEAHCALGSVKSNIGHCLTAAGVAGVIKLVLAIKHRVLPPSLNFAALNEHIKLAQSPFYVNTECRAWAVNNTPRLAAVSSFGFSGTNAHLVIGEDDAPVVGVAGSESGQPYLVPLSAKTPVQLVARARDLLTFIEAGAAAPSLRSLAYTLQFGRQAMDERLGILASTVDELTVALRGFLAGQLPESAVQGSVKTHREELRLLTQDGDMRETVIQQLLASKRWHKLLMLWAKGLALDWSPLWPAALPSRVALPGYPFARERFWFERTGSSAAASNDRGVSLEPLVQRNISDLSGQRFASDFAADDSELVSYQQGGARCYATGNWLAMATRSVALALPDANGLSAFRLQHLRFSEPQLTSAALSVTIDLQALANAAVAVEIIAEDVNPIPLCTGTVATVNNAQRSQHDLLALRAQLAATVGATELTRADVYQALAARGYVYPSPLQTVVAVLHNGSEAFAQVHLNGDAQANFVVAIEAGVQLSLLLNSDLMQLCGLPLAVESIEQLSAFAGIGNEAFIRVRTENSGRQPTNDKVPARLHLDVFNAQGDLCIQAQGLALTLSTRTLLPQAIRPQPVAAVAVANQFFRERWQSLAETAELALDTGGDATSSRRVVFACDALPAGLFGEDALVVERGETFSKVSDRHYLCRDGAETDLLHLLSTLEFSRPATLIYGWSMGQQQAGVHGLFRLFSAIKVSGAAVARVVLCGQYSPTSEAGCWDYAWIGLARSVGLELPQLDVQLVYTDSRFSSAEPLLRPYAHSVVWYRQAEPQALVSNSFQPNQQLYSGFQAQGQYVITGGLGGLGYAFARHLASHFQAHLLLIGRRSAADAEPQLQRLRELGAASVVYLVVDFTDVSDSEFCLALEPHLRDLRGVIHAAGIESQQSFHQKSERDINAVLAAKVRGAQLLDALLTNRPAAFVCYFSSAAAILGDLGSGDYAVANRYLMAHAAYREACERSGKTTVINWPLWDQGGMGQGTPEQIAYYLQSSGQAALATDDGIGLCQQLLGSEATEVTVMCGDPGRIRHFVERQYRRLPAPVAELPSPAPVHPRAAAVALDEQVRVDLTSLLAAQLKIASENLDAETNFAEYGLDSIGSAGFARTLSQHFGLEITPAVFFSHATLQQLSQYLLTKYASRLRDLYRSGPLAEDAVTSAPLAAPPVAQRRGPKRRNPGTTIAIVGMAGRFPGADNVDGLWRMLAAGDSGISEIPAQRWDWRSYYSAPGRDSNRIATNRGGFIAGVDEFDPLFFEISPREAETMDPAVRLLLQTAYHCIEDARCDPASLRGRRVGVFVGMEESQYGLVTDAQGVSTGGNAMISSRLSYFMDFHGPTLAINTACSSGLVALHQAAGSLRQGECEAALVGAAALSLSPLFFEKMSQAGMLSADGECFSFGDRANGIAVAEAVVVVMLKPLSAALADGNPVYGTLQASGVNFDGKTNGVTAPNGKMQAALIADTYRENHIDPAQVSHIVTHGTGTRLGDPVEIDALHEAFAQLQAPPSSRCALTSCKSNVGHTMAASGLVSLVTLLKEMEHGQIAASLHCEQENSYLRWHDSPFFLNKSLATWQPPQTGPRLGAVSAFGRSGTNAHLVVAQGETQTALMDPPAGFTRPVVIPLSAATPEQRREVAQRLQALLTSDAGLPVGSEDARLWSLAFSLQTTREAMEYRWCCLANSVADVTQQLQAWLEDGSAGFTGQGAAAGKPSLCDTRMAAADVARAWAAGADCDWRQLYPQGTPPSLPLPNYPFARETYWAASVPASGATVSGPHTSTGIAAILDQLDTQALAAEDAVAMIKTLVTE